MKSTICQNILFVFMIVLSGCSTKEISSPIQPAPINSEQERIVYPSIQMAAGSRPINEPESNVTLPEIPPEPGKLIAIISQNKAVEVREGTAHLEAPLKMKVGTESTVTLRVSSVKGKAGGKAIMVTPTMRAILKGNDFIITPKEEVVQAVDARLGDTIWEAYIVCRIVNDTP